MNGGADTPFRGVEDALPDAFKRRAFWARLCTAFSPGYGVTRAFFALFATLAVKIL